MEKIVSLAKRRGFIFPGSEIYGGLANSWDYGPLGVELKNNIKQEWWKRFVQSRDDVIGIETALIMNPKVWESSGHLKTFSDPLADCKGCRRRFRADQLKNKKKCPDCGGELTKARQFNLMFKTFIGPSEESSNVAYFRPETAQGMFVNFEQVINSTRKRLPFGIAQIGKAFRNEITPGNFIFRTLEFEQMEIEYFIKKEEWEKQFEKWLKEMKQWIKHLGIANKNIEVIDIPKKELAHYSKRTVDIFYKFPFGHEELYGLAYRSDFDLKNHNQSYQDPKTGKQFTPHIIEPTWGVERTVLAVMVESYKEESVKGETRVVMNFPNWLAPYKVAILPLSKKTPLTKLAKSIYKDLLPHFTCEYDETQSIGKRYRRQDEIGTPFCITVDFDSPKKKDVTVRDRNTMKQKRVKINKLQQYLNEAL
jgi:glycyl-tRNA synthetase